jgi:hypothetical protein
VQLQKLEELHDLVRDAADLKDSFVIGGRFKNGKEDSETGTVYVFNSVQVQDQPRTRVVKKAFKVLLHGFGDERIEPVNIIEADNGYIVDFLNL